MRGRPSRFPHEAGADPRLLAFLDRLCEPLERTLGSEELAVYRLQALAHLEMLAAELREFDGASPGEAVERALREYGRPEFLAIGLLDERCKGTRPVGFARGARSATLWTFVWFGLASALFTIVDAAALMSPGLGFLAPLVRPLAWLLPLVAGYLTGRTVPTGNLGAAIPAMAALVLYAGVAALVMAPFRDAGRLALGHALLAAPLGGASIYVTALLRRRPVRPRRRGAVA